MKRVNACIKPLIIATVVAAILVWSNIVIAWGGKLSVSIKKQKTFGHYHIDQIMVQASCAPYTLEWKNGKSEYIFEYKKQSGFSESKSETGIKDLKTLDMYVTCESIGKDSYSNMKPVSITLQTRYKGELIDCGQQKLKHPSEYYQKGEITTFSEKKHQCKWSIRS